MTAPSRARVSARASHGTLRLVRVILRRDRLRLGLWIGLLGGVIVVSAASLPPLYPDQRAIDEYAALFRDNPALVALAGPGYGFDRPNLGVILVNETQLWGMIGVALMASFLTVRHTRAEEDVERAELVRSSVVGRHAPTLAAALVVTVAIGVLTAACAVAFVVLGYATMGSLALAASMTGVGWMFVGFAVVAAQVFATARAALAAGMVLLVAAFLARALGDIGDNALRWASPLGWAQAVRAFAQETWWPLLGCLVVTVALVAGGFALADRRDLGAGLIAARRGSPHGRGLGRPGRLAWRLHRATFAVWAVGMFIGGAVYGSIADDIERLIEDNPAFADLLAQLQGASLVDAFFATSISLLGAVSAGAMTAALMRLRTEESAGRVEALWASPLSRWRWAGEHLAMVLVGSVVVLAAAGLGLGGSYAVVIGDASQIVRLTVSTLATLPGVVALGAGGVVVIGWRPRLAMAMWVALGVVVIVDFFGELLRLPQWVRWVSPFRHLSAVPAEPMNWVAFSAVTAVAVALGSVGLVGLRRRDLQPS
jgi:ABC-2 type transport system permease protein